MRRLTLILSDLYLPEEAGRGGSVPDSLSLPNLDWLLRFAARARRIEDWRSWLSADLGAFDLAQTSVAQVCALGSLPASSASNAWLATPVHLEARMDHVRLANRGLLRLGTSERETWCRDFALAFGPEYALHDVGERSFLLTGAAPARVASVDPARLLDADIGTALPTGPSAGELRRLGTEIEMWLHGAQANTARENLRLRRVSALWFWGGGVQGGSTAAPMASPALPHAKFFGGDPFLRALAGASLNPAPVVFDAAQLGDERCVVEFAPMSGSKSESLTELDSQWFAPVRAALSRGECVVDLIANDRWFRIASRPGWRLWRKRASWLEQLAR